MSQRARGREKISQCVDLHLSLPTSTTSLIHNSPRKPEEMQPLQLSDIELNFQWGVGVGEGEEEDGWGKEGGGEEEQEIASGVSEGRGRVGWGAGVGVLVTIRNRQEERPAMIMNCQFHPPAFTNGQPRRPRSREDALWPHAGLTSQPVSSAADSPWVSRAGPGSEA